MSAKNDAEFPKGWLKAYITYDGGDHVERFIPTFDPKNTEDWFKRCMEDFPRYPVIGRGDPWTHREYEAWFKKWFTQFGDKGRK